MDSATAIGLISSVIDITTIAFMYVSDVRNCRKDRTRLASEAASLLPLLVDLRSSLQDSNGSDSGFLVIRSLGCENGALYLFRKAMEELADNLRP